MHLQYHTHVVEQHCISLSPLTLFAHSTNPDDEMHKGRRHTGRAAVSMKHWLEAWSNKHWLEA